MFDGVERELGENPSLSLIWLHGLGADASDFLPIVGQFPVPEPVRFVFPNAPVRPVTINGGVRMRALYDIKGFGAGAADDTEGLYQSVAEVHRLIEREQEDD